MRMYLKRNTLLLLCCLHYLSGNSQPPLSESTSLFRPGDVIVKQELQYKAPGRGGRDAVWDFSELSFLGSEYTERFVGRIDSCLMSLGGNDGYKYKLSGDSLFCIGYQTPTLRIDHLLPELRQVYPTAYKDSVHSFYYGEGVYSQTLPITVYGETTRVADGIGTLLLPDGDSLKNVLRIRGTARIGQRMSPFTSIYANGDSSRYSTDSLLYRLQNDEVTWEVTTYQWYAPGYRYPLFETVQNKIVRSSGSKRHFNRSYYFPPVDQHYLSHDASNQEIRAELAYREERTPPEEAHGKRSLNGTENFTYDYSLGADRLLNVSYRLGEASTVEFYLYTTSGYTLWHKHFSDLSPGNHAVDYDLSSLDPGTYLFTFVVNGERYTEKISTK